jgi:hypothetical protein
MWSTGSRVRPHVSSPKLLSWFWWNVLLKVYIKSCRANWSLSESYQCNLLLYMKRKYILFHFIYIYIYIYINWYKTLNTDVSKVYRCYVNMATKQKRHFKKCHITKFVLIRGRCMITTHTRKRQNFSSVFLVVWNKWSTSPFCKFLF